MPILEEFRTARVVVPTGGNYFYELLGQRIAECFRAGDIRVDIGPIGEEPERVYDIALFCGIHEVFDTCSDGEKAWSLARTLVGRARFSLSASMDCVSTIWFQRAEDLSRSLGLSGILDLGLVDQTPALTKLRRRFYRYVPNGLTPSERKLVLSRPLSSLDDHRTIPWALIAHQTSERARLADLLVQRVDPLGFIYLPQLAPYHSQSAHLDESAQHRVLSRTRFQVWRSHHAYPYLEVERFRNSLLSGSVPLKVVDEDQEFPCAAFFDYLIVKESEIKAWLDKVDFLSLRARFMEDYLRFPGLEMGLLRLLAELGGTRVGNKVPLLAGRKEMSWCQTD